MKKIFALLYIVSLGACNANPSPAEVEQKLKTAMNDYLYKSVNYDSSKVKYRVQDVIYFNDKDFYDCELKFLCRLLAVRIQWEAWTQEFQKILKQFSEIIKKQSPESGALKLLPAWFYIINIASP